MTEPPLRESTFSVSAGHRGLRRAGKPLVILVISAVGCIGGYAVYERLVAVERKIERLENNVTASVGRLVAPTTNLEEILASQRRIEAALARLPVSSSPTPRLEWRPNLSEADLELLRSFFKLTKTAAVPPRFKLGDQLSGSELKAMPDFVVEKISAELRGTRFLLDRNGSLVITAGLNNEVIVVVSAQPAL